MRIFKMIDSGYFGANLCPLPTHALEDPSSLFMGEDDEVYLKFDMFLSDCPDEEDDNAYLWLR